MKKIILSIAAAMLFAQFSYGQGFVQKADNTGFDYDCDEAVGLTGASWAQYMPVCDFSSENGGGGFDNAAVNELKIAWGQGGAGKVYNILTLATPLDLSTAANQRIKFTIRCTNGTSGTPVPYTLVMENDGNTGQLLNTVDIPLTNVNQTYDIDLSTYIFSGANLSNVKKIIFYYERCPITSVVGDDLFISNFKVGSSITGVTDSEGTFASANVFPNPSTGVTTITAELPSMTDVKVSLTDMYGREVKVIAEGNMTAINASFDVSNLAKGVYMVNYQVSGKATKVQKLVVR
jgi:hypothetical protein